jgi:acetolactate synthase I/II/III large subunit
MTRRYRVVDCIVEHLAVAGVDYIFGVDGANIEDLYVTAHFRGDPALPTRCGAVGVFKAYGLPGLRIGHGFGSPELAKTVWTMQLSFGMGTRVRSRSPPLPRPKLNYANVFG